MTTRRERRLAAARSAANRPTLDRRALREHHLLITPSDLTMPELTGLLSMRSAAATMRREDELDVDGAVITGPWTIPDNLAQEYDLPGDTAYFLRVTPERGAPVPRELFGLDEVADAFDDGAPVGAEMRVLRHAEAVARFLGGALRLAGPGLVVVPDADAAIDRTVWASYLLSSEDLIAAAQPHLGELDTTLDDGSAVVLSAPGPVGLISIEAFTLPHVPLATHGTGWSKVSSYEVRWRPESPERVYGRRPSLKMRRMRAEAAELISATAFSIERATGGMTVDDDGFIRHEC